MEKKIEVDKEFFEVYEIGVSSPVSSAVYDKSCDPFPERRYMVGDGKSHQEEKAEGECNEYRFSFERRSNQEWDDTQREVG